MRFAPLPLALLGVILAVSPAAAYVGPGAGVGALGAIFGVFAAIFMSLFVILLWPVRRLLRRMRKPATSGPQGEDGSAA